jgi:hypothetical protein
MVTRRVNEAATVHAPSLIRTANYPGSASLTLRVTKSSLTVRVTIDAFVPDVSRQRDNREVTLAFRSDV